jgi:2,3-bisphosphoglycerate-independent phosphoglycerate mutase
MRAKEIADAAIDQIQKGTDFIFINFANADMVGHTANREALIEAVEEVDFQFDRVSDAVIKNGGVAIITADHGNAEIYYDIVTDSKHTAHTLSLVPFIITKEKLNLSENGTLADITPTILELFGIKKPDFMTGRSLIIK